MLFISWYHFVTLENAAFFSVFRVSETKPRGTKLYATYDRTEGADVVTNNSSKISTMAPRNGAVANHSGEYSAIYAF